MVAYYFSAIMSLVIHLKFLLSLVCPLMNLFVQYLIKHLIQVSLSTTYDVYETGILDPTHLVQQN